MLVGVGAALLLSAVSTFSWAEGSDDAETAVSETDYRMSETLRSEAREWGLDERDLERYESLMEGVRGIWSPDLDPVTVLGVEARTDEERRRYAEILVEMERRRVERELAFQRAYDDAWERLYPEAMPVTPFLMNGDGAARESILSEAGVTSSSNERLTVHVAAQGCDRCDDAIDELLASGSPMDIFVIDSDDDDQVIRTWARENAIPPDRVQAREITLNHGYPLPSLGVTRGSVPQVFQQ